MNLESMYKIRPAGAYDVVVAGGGMAGFSAACAAGRKGAKVLLIERTEMLGGLASNACVGNFSYGDGKPVGQGKIFDDIIDTLYRLKAIGDENGFAYRVQKDIYHNMTFDFAVLPYALQHIADSYGVNYLYATDVVGTREEDGCIKEVVIHNKSLLQSVKGKVFIDATGEGILSFHAGAKPVTIAEIDQKNVIQPSNMVFLHKSGAPVPQETLEGIDNPGVRYSIWPDKDRTGIKMNLFHRIFDTSTGWGHSEAVRAFRREVPHFVRNFQENKDSGYVFEFASPVLGIREGSRVEGDYILDAEDVKLGRRFEDSVAYATSCIDTHKDDIKVPPYQIPFRSLIVKGISNLLVAGRCFSGTRDALASARVMATCSMMGQAAGYAAAHAAPKETGIRNVDPAQIRSDLMEGARDLDMMRSKLCP